MNCRICQTLLDDTNHSAHSKKVSDFRCKNCIKEHQAAYNTKQRLKVLNHYGAVCIYCGETKTELLQVDHVHGDGANHMNKKGTKRLDGLALILHIIENNYPVGKFQVLCRKCNMMKGNMNEIEFIIHMGKIFANLAAKRRYIEIMEDMPFQFGYRAPNKVTLVYDEEGNFVDYVNHYDN